MHATITLDHARDTAHTASRPLWLLYVVLAMLFLLAEHDLTRSQLDSFALSISEEGENIAEGDGLRKLSMLLLAVVGMGLFLRPGGQTLQPGSGLTLVAFLYLGWCVLSVLWSDDPALAVRRLGVLACWVAAGLGICRQASARQLAWMALIVIGIHIGVGLCAEIVLRTFHPFSGDYRFAGTVHPNSQGYQCAVVCLAAFCLLPGATRYRWQLRLLLAASIILLLLTRSRSSLAALVAALGACAVLRQSGWGRSLAVIGLVWSVSMAGLALVFFEDTLVEPLVSGLLLGREDQALSLTGRVPLWSYLLRYVWQRPWTGYGYESFWSAERMQSISAEFEWTIPNAHNGYLDAVLSLGLVGATLLGCCLFGALLAARSRFRAYRDAGHELMFALLVFGAVGSLLESGFFSASAFISFIALCGLVHLAMRPAAASAPAGAMRRRSVLPVLEGASP